MKPALPFQFFYFLILMALTSVVQASGDRSVAMDSTLLERAITLDFKELKGANQELYYLGSNNQWHVFAYIESSNDRSSSNAWSWPWSDPEPIPMPSSNAVTVKLDFTSVKVLNNQPLLLDGRSQYIPQAYRVISVTDEVVEIHSKTAD
jgi:hypothetical protein